MPSNEKYLLLSRCLERAGSCAELARQLGVSYLTVLRWVNRSNPPSAMAVKIMGFYEKDHKK